MSVTVAILAGGESRRMGRDKATIEVDGVSLLERVARAALAAELPVLVVGRLRPEWWRLEGVEFINEPDHRGPLSGLEAALRHTGSDLILAACDMPRLSREAFLWLAEAARSTSSQGVVTINGERIEPLFSFYRARSLGLVTQLLLEGSLAMHELVRRGEFEQMNSPEWLQAELHNVNRPEDLDGEEGLGN